MLAQLIGLMLRLVLFVGGLVGVTQFARFAWRKWGPDPRRRLKSAWREWRGDPLIAEALGYREWMVKRAIERPTPFVEDMLSDTNGLLDCLVELAVSKRDLEELEVAQRRLPARSSGAESGPESPQGESKTVALTTQMNEILRGLRDAYQSLVLSQAPDLSPVQSRLRTHHESLRETTRAMKAMSTAAAPPEGPSDDDRSDNEETPGKASA